MIKNKSCLTVLCDISDCQNLCAAFKNIVYVTCKCLLKKLIVSIIVFNHRSQIGILGKFTPAQISRI